VLKQSEGVPLGPSLPHQASNPPVDGPDVRRDGEMQDSLVVSGS
jgi:hypothetical protein